MAAAAAAGAAAGSAGGGYGAGRYDERTPLRRGLVLSFSPVTCDCFCGSGARLLVEGGRLLLPSYGWMEKDAPDARPRTPTR